MDFWEAVSDILVMYSTWLDLSQVAYTASSLGSLYALVNILQSISFGPFQPDCFTREGFMYFEGMTCLKVLAMPMKERQHH